MKPHEVLALRIREVNEAMPVIVWSAVAHLEDQIRKQAGLSDHSLRELRRMGHPYRMRAGFGATAALRKEDTGGFWGVDKNGKWFAGIRRRSREIREESLGHDIKFVHMQSNTLVDNIQSDVWTEGTTVIGAVWIDPADVEYVEYVVKGTRKMIPRDFIGIGAIRARNGIFTILQNGLNNIFRQ